MARLRPRVFHAIERPRALCCQRKKLHALSCSRTRHSHVKVSCLPHRCCDIFCQLGTRYLQNRHTLQQAAEAYSWLGRSRLLPHTASFGAHMPLSECCGHFSFTSCPRGYIFLFLLFRTHPTRDEACGRGVRAPGAPSYNDKKHGFNCHYGPLCLTQWPLPDRENQQHCG